MQKTILTSALMLAALSLSAQLRPELTEAMSTHPLKVAQQQSAVSRMASYPTSAAAVAKAPALATTPDAEATVYAFMPYDFERFSHTNSFVRFTTDWPDEWSFYKIRDFDTRRGPDYPEITAGTFVGDEYWAYFKAPYDLLYWESMGIYKVDTETGDYSVIDGYYWFKDKNVLYPMDMSYDVTTGLIWYVAPITSNPIQFNGFNDASTLGWALCYIDTKSAEPYPVQFGPDLPQCVTCIAADHGKIYGLSVKPNMLQNDVITSYIQITPNLSRKNYEFTNVRDYAKSELYCSIPCDWASMELDRTNRRLYASYTDLDDGCVYFTEFDMETGDMLETAKQGGAIIVNAMAMPYQTCPDDAPFYPGQLTVTTGAEGVPTADLVWELPTQTYMHQPLLEISGIRVLRDGTEIATLDGTATSYTDQDVPFGEHQYRVLAYNSAGDGLYASRQAFVGRDTPGMPVGLSIKVEGATANLVWGQPTVGAHGAWVDFSTVTYTVTRHPDEVVLAEGLTATRYTDTVDKVEGYSYTVTACNAEGVGMSATTEVVSFGPNAAIPFFSNLTRESEFLKWEVFDENHDGFAWAYNEYFAATIYDASMCGNTPNDLLFSPVLDTQSGQKYKLTYQVKVHNYVDTEEKFEWYAGPFDADPSWKGDRIDAGSYTSMQSLVWHTRQAVFEGEDGGTRLSFVVRSNPMQGILYLGNLNVRLYSDYDLAVTNITGSEIASEGRVSPISVTVKNEGKSTVSSYKIKVWDEETRQETIQEFTDPIASEAELVCAVDWIPTAQGQFTLHAEVLLDGDTFEYDNASTSIHQIIVNEASDEEWKTIGQFKKTDSNWCGINFPYSQSQALYLAEEVNLKPGTKITGIGFAYEGNEEFEGFDMVNFEVSMGNTDLPLLYDFYQYAFDWNYYPSLQPSSMFTATPFFGFVPFNAPEGTEGHLMFPFDEPFEYDGRNLLIKVVRVTSTKLAGAYAQFHYDVLDPSPTAENNPDARAVYIEAQDEVVDGAMAKGHGLNQLPILYLGYDVSEGEGIRGIKTVGPRIVTDARNGQLYLNQTCQHVVLTDVDGRTIFQGRNVNQIPVGQGATAMGILTATLADGTTTTVKVRVR